MFLVDPLKRLLPAVVDFDLINSGGTRFTLGLTTVKTGQMRYFDNKQDKIGVEHILGSSAIPPSFPAVQIDGAYYWDGGVYSSHRWRWFSTRTPGIAPSSSRYRYGTREARNPNHSHMLSCAKKTYCSEADPGSTSCEASPSFIGCRRIIRELVDLLPEDRKSSPRIKELAGWGCTTTIHLVEINAQPFAGETNARDDDFSRAAIQARRQAGYATHAAPWSGGPGMIQSIPLRKLPCTNLTRRRQNDQADQLRN